MSPVKWNRRCIGGLPNESLHRAQRSGKPAPPLPRGPLSERIPGHSVIEELLAKHQQDPERSRLARIFGARPLGSESVSWYWGALGELTVGRSLAQLGPEWTVLHAVPVGRDNSDIDHVVIGPGGVFTLNTKNHTGQSVWTANNTLMVAGKKQRHIYNAVFEADRAGKLLSAAIGRRIPVAGAVVIVGAKTLTIKENHPTVAVLTQAQLLRWLRRRRTVFTAAQVAAVTAAAVEPGTWHRSPREPIAPSAVAAQFSALRAQIGQARRRRVGWFFATATAVLLTLFGVLPAI